MKLQFIEAITYKRRNAVANAHLTEATNPKIMEYVFTFKEHILIYRSISMVGEESVKIINIESISPS